MIIGNILKIGGEILLGHLNKFYLKCQVKRYQ